LKLPETAPIHKGESCGSPPGEREEKGVKGREEKEGKKKGSDRAMERKRGSIKEKGVGPS
jgi:hypothetical protein